MKFTTFIVTNIHVSVLEYLSPTATLYTCIELTCIVLEFCYFECPVTMFLSLQPWAYIFWTIRLNLPASTMFEPMTPLTLIDCIDCFTYEFNNTISISLVVLELSWVDIFSWIIFVSPAYFLSFTWLIYYPSSIVKFAFVVPNNCSILVQNKRHTVSIFFYT